MPTKRDGWICNIVIWSRIIYVKDYRPNQITTGCTQVLSSVTLNRICCFSSKTSLMIESIVSSKESVADIECSDDKKKSIHWMRYIAFIIFYKNRKAYKNWTISCCTLLFSILDVPTLLWLILKGSYTSPHIISKSCL